ncbi:hypothetical protein C4569_01545 [Candidatus Parcubacteria bacterium]|nr:MAG: hypothetical protein C4569_01545 [Candidatus Parcubacteria bacterium]
MLETSKDLLYVVIAFSLLWVVIFISWALYYVIQILKNSSKMMKSLRQKMELVDDILKLVKDKLEKTSSHIGVLADSAIKIVGYILEQKRGSRGKKKR